MDKPLIKFYLIFTMSLILVLTFEPMILGRTNAWVTQAKVKANLLIHQDSSGSLEAFNDKGKVVIVMDDGWETQFTQGYKILRQYGFKACIAVIPSAVDTFGYMSYSQLAELYMNGWDMLNHTYDHVVLSGQAEENQVKQIVTARDWLESNLLSRGSNILVYPQGEFTKEIKLILKENGFIAARSLKSLWIADTDITPEDVEICNLISDMSVEKAKEHIDKAEHNKSTVILLLHKIEPVTNETQMQFDEEKFKRIVEYIASKQENLQVVTMTELLKNQQ